MLEVVVLAAGAGTRMRSRVPKVFHTLLDSPILAQVIRAVQAASPARIHVIIQPAMQELAEQTLGHDEVNWVHQESQDGTGHAVLQALPHIAKDATVAIVTGDTPLLSAQTIQKAASGCPEGITIVTAELEDPCGYGRIERNSNGQVIAIVEDKDASQAQQAIREVNSGIIGVSRTILEQLLGRLTRNNAQNELYLTEIVQLAVETGIPVQTVTVEDPDEIRGINDRVELAEVEKILRSRRVRELMQNGLTLRDPERFDLRGKLVVGLDCVIDVNVLIEGEVRLGDGVYIGPGSVLRSTEIETDAKVLEYSILESAKVGKRCSIGPFARIRPGTSLADEVRVGNFVEVKASQLGKGAKTSHLAYIGDANIGANTNIGAGAITCNFDGERKHQTVIGDDVFVGTNSTLIAPLNVHSGAFIAAGTTVTRDVKSPSLVVSRTRQREIENWVPPTVRRKKP
ncbi:MAG: UDP-N-acetylglucosamine diphosphorylase/glucosamine-1-phosphate N-acetyltransferase [Gammaproteobacteria bacterium]|nr:UDP-N-acetylglucosamine diphosphorylase/glucosamine-1-phosphate N-acetyltransferase [Gammaproteobacteria bacterium]MYF03436.1 UDP-N-acetylglucosamine diphosphorylase/glucosamine-1-phosphate N-acetyltransferase [Gammaproteobacteria bacterium]MYI77345.1 UDP-N-acetylglucosamine diphosphorylase/glucosamine-1-phosphate N-acetyltransferase [Gammaproteobacteria bacterium]